MSQTSCPDCFQNFSRRDVMLRHRRNTHSDSKISQAYPQTRGAYPPPPPPPPPQGGIQPLPPPLQLPQQGGIPRPLPWLQPPQGSIQLPPHPLPHEEMPTPPLCLSQPPQPPVKACNRSVMVFQHPFTMMISGPTGIYFSYYLFCSNLFKH